MSRLGLGRRGLEGFGGVVREGGSVKFLMEGGLGWESDGGDGDW